ncbi:hypothetical protein U1Q18_005515 [Sarracenia purpurea var. burkii]
MNFSKSRTRLRLRSSLEGRSSSSMAGPSIMDSLFKRTLDDLIKGLCLQIVGESTFISKALEEICREIKSTIGARSTEKALVR